MEEREVPNEVIIATEAQVIIVWRMVDEAMRLLYKTIYDKTRDISGCL